MSKPKRQHTDRTLKEKIEILNKLDSGVKAIDLCRQFSLVSCRECRKIKERIQ